MLLSKQFELQSMPASGFCASLRRSPELQINLTCQ
jgi:hypothetical protein